MDILEKNEDWNKMVSYLKVISKHYPKEYYIKTISLNIIRFLATKKNA